MFDLYINTHPVDINILNKDNEVIDKLVFKFPTKWINSGEVEQAKSTNALFNNKNTSASKYTEDVKINGKVYDFDLYVDYN